MVESRKSRMGFWKRAVVGGLTALIMYTSGGCGAAVSRPALRVEEDLAQIQKPVPEMVVESYGEESYARAPRAGVEVVEEDHLEKIVREMREALEESDEILSGDFQTYLQKRRERLEKQEDPLMKYSDGTK